MKFKLWVENLDDTFLHDIFYAPAKVTLMAAADHFQDQNNPLGEKMAQVLHGKDISTFSTGKFQARVSRFVVHVMETREETRKRHWLYVSPSSNFHKKGIMCAMTQILNDVTYYTSGFTGSPSGSDPFTTDKINDFGINTLINASEIIGLDDAKHYNMIDLLVLGICQIYR